MLVHLAATKRYTAEQVLDAWNTRTIQARNIEPGYTHALSTIDSIEVHLVATETVIFHVQPTHWQLSRRHRTAIAALHAEENQQP